MAALADRSSFFQTAGGPFCARGPGGAAWLAMEAAGPGAQAARKLIRFIGAMANVGPGWGQVGAKLGPNWVDQGARKNRCEGHLQRSERKTAKSL